MFLGLFFFIFNSSISTLYKATQPGILSIIWWSSTRIFGNKKNALCVAAQY